MIKTSSLKPFLKWAGGKRQLLPVLSKYVPTSYNRYYEPFVGAGALFFQQQPKAGKISDTNPELINCYRIIRDFPEALINKCLEHQENHSKDYFYYVRNFDREESYSSMGCIAKAARILYLNKTCFNGLYRVNKKGQFNSPFGDYTNPIIIDLDLILNISSYLSQNNIEIACEDFLKGTSNASKGDFVYLDPPYYPLTSTSNFTSYSAEGFKASMQEQLKLTCDYLREKNCSILLSNSDTPFIRKLYSDYNIDQVQASRSINSKSGKRGKVGEVLIHWNIF